MALFRVLESRLCSKAGSPDGGDDLLVVTPHFAAVLDGATDGSGATYGGVGAARFVAQIGAQVIRALPPDITAREAVTRMSTAVGQALQETVPSHAPSRPPCFVFVLYSAARRELWRVGDAQYLIDGQGHNPETAVDAVVLKARQLVTQAHLLAGESVQTLRRDDPGREAVKPLLELQTQFMNRADSPYGYGAVSGGEVPEKFTEVISVPASAQQIVLVSDGYPELKPTLKESEAWLEYILEHDPLFIDLHLAAKGWRPGAASFDDRAYVRLELDV